MTFYVIFHPKNLFGIMKGKHNTNRAKKQIDKEREGESERDNTDDTRKMNLAILSFRISKIIN